MCRKCFPLQNRHETHNFSLNATFLILCTIIFWYISIYCLSNKKITNVWMYEQFLYFNTYIFSCSLGIHYTQQFCLAVTNSVVNPFTLHDVALEAAMYFGHYNPNPTLCPSLSPLIEKCHSMFVIFYYFFNFCCYELPAILIAQSFYMKFDQYLEINIVKL